VFRFVRQSAKGLNPSLIAQVGFNRLKNVNLSVWQKPGFWQEFCISTNIYRQKPGFLMLIEHPAIFQLK
jgi:hypothetical protein